MRLFNVDGNNWRYLFAKRIETSAMDGQTWTHGELEFWKLDPIGLFWVQFDKYLSTLLGIGSHVYLMTFYLLCSPKTGSLKWTWTCGSVAKTWSGSWQPASALFTLWRHRKSQLSLVRNLTDKKDPKALLYKLVFYQISNMDVDNISIF